MVRRVSVLTAVLLASVVEAPAAPSIGTAFTYQGRLTVAGSPADAPYDLQFGLFGAPTGASQVGSTLTRTNVPVTAGLFTVVLDFGAQFPGAGRWLEIAVRPGGSGGSYTPLVPRQELTPSPHALFSAKAGDAATLGGVSAAGFVLTGAVIGVGNGGTGATTAAGARASLQAAQSGANSDITSLSGLSTPLSIAQGGTGGATATAALTSLGAQARVTGTCPAGSSVQTINSDGTVVCLAETLPQPGFTLTTLDSPGQVGQYTSVTIGRDGLGLISYRDSTATPTFGLKVAHCANPACTSSNNTTLDSTGDVGEYTSVTIGTDGLGLISYYDHTNGDLKVAHCADTACTSSTNTTLDSTGDVGQYTSVTIGADGLGLISYVDVTNLDLKVAHCVDIACTASAKTTLDTGNVGSFTSAAIGADGLGLIGYRDGGSFPPSLLKVAHCSDTACSSATTAPIDGVSEEGWFLSLAIGADGLGLISYYERGTTRDLKVAHCSDTACTKATIAVLDTNGFVGQYTSVTIGRDGLGLISYLDQSNGNLKVAHCSNLLCSPFVVRPR